MHRRRVRGERERRAAPPGSRALAGVLLVVAILLGIMAIGRPLRRPGPTDPPLTALPEMRLDLNRATAAELEILPGVGPATAHRIVEARGEGRFGSLGELERVRGIGPRRIQNWREHLVVGVGKDRQGISGSSD